MARQQRQGTGQNRRSRRSLWRGIGLVLAVCCWALVMPTALASGLASGLVAESTSGSGHGAPVWVSVMPMASMFGSLFAGQRPSTLGVRDGGTLAPCPASPNCVSTAAAPADLQHAIAPWRYANGDVERAWTDLQATVEAASGNNIIESRAIADGAGYYLYAEFSTSLMGFVDDVEFYVDPAAGEIQARSASRLGQSDLGLNRKRIEQLHAQFEQRQLS